MNGTGLAPFRGDVVTDPDKKRDYNRKMFGIISQRYSAITRIMSFGRDAAWKEALLNALPPSVNGTALDLACGTGDITFGLARRYPSAGIVGVDLTKEMLSIAAARNAFGNVAFLLQDMARTGLKDGTAAVVTGGYALRNAPDIDKALSEIWRVLKPGGIAAFLDFSKSTQPVVQQFHYWLLRLWGSFWGFLFHGNPAVYAYIAESLKAFPDKTVLDKKANTLGFVSRRVRTFMGGMIALTLWEKPSGSPIADN